MLKFYTFLSFILKIFNIPCRLLKLLYRYYQAAAIHCYLSVYLRLSVILSFKTKVKNCFGWTDDDTMCCSNGVSSVISDYIVSMPTILPSDPSLLNEKFIQLQGDPWTSEDVKQTQRLQMCLIACLIKEGYKLCMDVNIDTTSRVFFFIKNTEDTFGEVLVPDMAGISIGRNNRPVVLRSKSSFFRTYKGKGRTNSLKKRLRNSMRRKELPSPPAGQPGQPSGQPTLGQPALRYKPRLAEPAWWQQTSTDMSSDQEGEE